MHPFPFLAVAAALLSDQVGATRWGYAAFAIEEPSGTVLAISARGEVWAIQSATRDAAGCMPITNAAPFASLTWSTTGKCYALTRSGAVAQGSGTTHERRTWRDCGLLGGTCGFVALVATGSPERLAALSTCGELHVMRGGSCAWELASQVPDPSQRFVALSRRSPGGLHALTAAGRVWSTADIGVDRTRWVLDGELPDQLAPYVAVAGGDRVWALSAAGEIVMNGPEPGQWSPGGRIPAPLGEVFTGLVQGTGGTRYALTSGGTLWRANVDASGQPLWHWYAELPRPGPDAGPHDERSLPRLVVMPNPVLAQASVRLSLPVGGFVHLELHDAAGRIVRTVLAERREAGDWNVPWDGTLDAGRPAPAGVYFMRIRCDGLEAVERVQVVR